MASGGFLRQFIDVSVVNPFPDSYKGLTLPVVHKRKYIDFTRFFYNYACPASGCEAAVHAVWQMFNDVNPEALLQVDADNAFNSLNSEVAMRNIPHSCPSIGCVLANTYREDVSMFIDGESIFSLKGTTQEPPRVILWLWQRMH